MVNKIIRISGVSDHSAYRKDYMAKSILLSQGYSAIVDDEDFEWLSQWKWYYHEGYAVRNYKGKTIRMHRQILDAKDDKEVDHVNRNRLDNRRHNLRECNRRQNQANKWKTGHKDHSSKYKGVSRKKNENKWCAQIECNDKNLFLGYFDNEVVAANVYNHKAKEVFGEFALLNDVIYIPLEECHKRKFNKVSQYKGVTWVNKTKNWYASFWSKIEKRYIYIGSFYDEIDAAQAYNDYLIKNNVKDSKPNDISKGYSNVSVGVASKRKTSSSYTGVSYCKDKDNWRSYIKFGRKRIYIGYFKTELDAARAYNEKAIELYGESYSKLNVIDE